MLYAHSKEGTEQCEWQTLEDHSFAVAERAADFARVYGGDRWAYLVGLLHDAGKASSRFQARLSGGAERVDHSSAGAQILSEKYGSVGKQLAYLVSGHHGGMLNGTAVGERSSLRERLAKQVESYDAYFDLVDLPTVEEVNAAIPPFLRQGKSPKRVAYSFAFLLKMLFSGLVDADYLDTEKVLDETRSEARAYRGLSLEEMDRALDEHLMRLESMASAQGVSDVNEARSDIRSTCVKAADCDSGVFTLAVPTGGGKTLSGLSFALKHALRNGQERVIFIEAYTTVIEQVAEVFKGIFGRESVLEHHSNYAFSDSDDEDDIALYERLAMENWDVPLVVTTNVQFFESIYSNRVSRCRKVHNIANSVVVLDEAQSLPDPFLKPCLAALEELCDNYSTSVVLCSATQPALSAEWPFESTPVDIVPKEHRHTALFDKRVEIEWEGARNFDALIDELSGFSQVLCVVGSRYAASAVYDKLLEVRGSRGLYHLSALMAPAHRIATLEQIREDLAADRQCVVVSTQLIEAGVDIDFPVVYREIAGIDSIKQVAGRCNREGKRAVGLARVFECQELLPKRQGWLSAMRQLGKETIERSDDPFGDAGVEEFFVSRYQFDDTDREGIFSELSDFRRMNDANYSFENYGKKFKLIDDDSCSVFVPWGEEGMTLFNRIAEGEMDAGLMRQMQRYTVSVPRYLHRQMVDAGRVTAYGFVDVLEPVAGRLVGYSEEKGLVAKESDVTLTI